MPADLQQLQQRIEYHFNDPALAQLAITHRSFNKTNNERLEFLGDAILGQVIAETLFNHFPAASEGELSRMRANLINRQALSEIAREMDLGSCMNLGAGEKKSGGKQRASILADAVEALIAAVCLDGGLENCRRFVLRLFASRLRDISDGESQYDCKTRLQELLQAKGLSLPEYRLETVSGEAHDQTFVMSCRVALLKEPELGQGRSKRIAEQQAAEKILLKLGHKF